MMRIGAALVATVIGLSPAMALDLSKLPQSCQATLAQMQSEKARFSQLGGLMQRYKKASDNENFCKASRETLALIIDQSGRLDACLSEAAVDKTVPGNLVDQLTQVRAVYKNMLEAAKIPQNDKFHCGLADQ